MSDSAHAQPPSLPEPRTPLWLPAVGVALFSIAGIGWALCPASSGDDVAAAAPAVPTTAGVTSRPVASVNIPVPSAAMRPATAPSASAAGSARAMPRIPVPHFVPGKSPKP